MKSLSKVLICFFVNSKLDTMFFLSFGASSVMEILFQGSGGDGFLEDLDKNYTIAMLA